MLPTAAAPKSTLLSCRCSASELVMIGDRYLTDVVYGNRHGLLTIRPAPLAVKGEPQMVQLVSSLLQPLCYSAATSYSWLGIPSLKEVNTFAFML